MITRELINEEFEKLQTEGMAYDYKNKFINMHMPTKKGMSVNFRPISEYNCYHYTFAIVLGVNNPEYTNEKLQEINDNNKKGFEFEGKHYTNYEVLDGTQWGLRFDYADGSYTEFDGSNAFPYNFNDLSELFGICELTEE